MFLEVALGMKLKPKHKGQEAEKFFHPLCVNELGSCCYFFAGLQWLAVCL